MNLKELIENFDFKNPDWSLLPECFPNCDLGEFNTAEVGKFLSIKTLWELSRPRKPKASRSRFWTDPEGYCYLVPWSNAVLLRYLVRMLTSSLPKSEYRRKAQLDDAARSVVRNIEEGYKRATTSEYSDFIGYSQGSLEEVKGDIRELTEDGFLKSRPGSTLASIGIDLGEFNRALKGDKGSRGGYRTVKDVKGNGGGNWDYVPLNVFYPPLKDVRPENLTYKIFLELINKTDWNLRQLVVSLEKKLSQEQKFYKVEQARTAISLGNGVSGNLRYVEG
mgnify:CR=1 FL=1